MQRREMAKFGPRQPAGFSSNFGSQYQQVRTSSPDVAATSHYDSYKAETSRKSAPSPAPKSKYLWLMSRPAVAPMKGKGMQLGKKQNTRLYDALSNEIASVEESTAIATPSPASATESGHARAPSTSSTEAIQISLIENTSARTNRDGGVEAIDVQGQLNLFIADATMSRIQLGLHSNDADGTQFKTHPNVDRNLFKDGHKIGLRDSSRPFPLNQQMSVLRWRLQAKADKIKLPISGSTTRLGTFAEGLVNMWPSPAGDGTTDVSIEYEIDSAGATLDDVVLTIPMPMYSVQDL